MKDQTIYIRAYPECIELDTEAGGARFAALLADAAQDSELSEIVLDLSGNVRLDYWGCSRVLDACLTLFGDSATSKEKTLKVLTSLRYDDKESYAWLFFKKCSAAVEFETAAGKSFSDLGIAICRKYRVKFHLYKVPLRFSYAEEGQALRTPNVVLSAQ